MRMIKLVLFCQNQITIINILFNAGSKNGLVLVPLIPEVALDNPFKPRIFPNTNNPKFALKFVKTPYSFSNLHFLSKIANCIKILFECLAR